MKFVQMMRQTLVVSLLALTYSAQAEPWLSTRYAQNCAGCHAPGRKNLPMAERRCTLACQGCHVSPNGGGLRSYYGKWNEDRWVRSFDVRALATLKQVAPVTKQKYGQKKNKYRAGKKPPQGGFKLVELRSLTSDRNEVLYDRRDKLEKIIDSTPNRDEFLYQVPEGDPYRQMDHNKIDAGLDARWQFRSATIKQESRDSDQEVQDTTETKRWSSFPMAVDVSLGLRPLNRKFRIVYELRATDNPGDKRPFDSIGSNGSVTSASGKASGAQLNRRSLYAMVDDLPYNLYVMAGFYRPMMGYYTPDHTFLPQVLQAAAFGAKPYAQEFLAYSVGGSPNLPFINLHYIVRGTNPDNDHLSGPGMNLGVRFVTMGISGNYSIYKLTDSTDAEYLQETLLQSLYGSIQVKKLTFTLDLQSIERKEPKRVFNEGDIAFRSGGSYAFDAYYQLWRSIYANAQYAFANTATDLTVGSTSQARGGLRAFLTAGTDISFHIDYQSETKTASDQSSTVTTGTGFISQIHLYM